MSITLLDENAPDTINITSVTSLPSISFRKLTRRQSALEKMTAFESLTRVLVDFVLLFAIEDYDYNSSTTAVDSIVRTLTKGTFSNESFVEIFKVAVNETCRSAVTPAMCSETFLNTVANVKSPNVPVIQLNKTKIMIVRTIPTAVSGKVTFIPTVKESTNGTPAIVLLTISETLYAGLTLWQVMVVAFGGLIFLMSGAFIYLYLKKNAPSLDVRELHDSTKVKTHASFSKKTYSPKGNKYEDNFHFNNIFHDVELFGNEFSSPPNLFQSATRYRSKVAQSPQFDSIPSLSKGPVLAFKSPKSSRFVGIPARNHEFTGVNPVYQKFPRQPVDRSKVNGMSSNRLGITERKRSLLQDFRSPASLVFRIGRGTSVSRSSKPQHAAILRSRRTENGSSRGSSAVEKKFPQSNPQVARDNRMEAAIERSRTYFLSPNSSRHPLSPSPRKSRKETRQVLGVVRSIDRGRASTKAPVSTRNSESNVMASFFTF